MGTDFERWLEAELPRALPTAPASASPRYGRPHTRSRLMRHSFAGLVALLPAKAAAAAAAVTLVAAGGTVALATHTITLPNPPGVHGNAVTQAVFGTCATLRPTPRPSGTTGASQPPASPGAFGQCVSAVARGAHGQGKGSANAHGAAGQGHGQSSGHLPSAAMTHGHGRASDSTGRPTPPAGPLS